MTQVDDFLYFLGSRYAKARTELDEVRIRALELVLAACVTELRENPPVLPASRNEVARAPTRFEGSAPIQDDVLASYVDDDNDHRDFMPSRELEETSELDVESYLKDELEWSEDPRPRRPVPTEPPPTSEVDLAAPPELSRASEERRTTAWEDETEDEPLTDATNWSSFPSDDEERAPEEPVRGAWDAPEN